MFGKKTYCCFLLQNRYTLRRNDGGLLTIDSNTAQIKFVKNTVRDVAVIVNKTITAEVLATDGKKKYFIFREMLLQLAFLDE